MGFLLAGKLKFRLQCLQSCVCTLEYTTVVLLCIKGGDPSF